MLPKKLWSMTIFILLSMTPTYQSMSCTYGARGSLTSTCINAIPSYFRTTAYRFDNLDETVRCLNCSLQVIESNTFDISGNQIKNLDLTGSQITVLKPKSFIGLVFLRKLYLQNNNIIAVPAETFQGVNRIEVLNIEHNSITALVANGFKELTNLKTLNLRNNRIKKIELGSFEGLGAVEEIHLSNNDIDSLQGVFRGLLNVASINLEGNRILKIEPADMKELTVLLQLNLARNSMKILSQNAFLEMPRLETLNLSSNPIETIEMGAFRGLYSLEDLDLSNGLIPDIQKGLLSNLHQLRKLDLSRNKIKSFRTGSYSGLPELRKLNLSRNSIAAYVKSGVLPLQHLNTLDLSGNNLKDLDYKLLIQHVPTLSSFQLRNNPFPCYLKKEMEEYFKNDNLQFAVGKDADVNVKCNDSRPLAPSTPPEVIDDGSSKTSEAQVAASGQKSSSWSGHVYILYVFMIANFALLGCLFYLKYRNPVQSMSWQLKRNISEEREIIGDLDSA